LGLGRIKPLFDVRHTSLNTAQMDLVGLMRRLWKKVVFTRRTGGPTLLHLDAAFTSTFRWR
jgi:hypothetical protein